MIFVDGRVATARWNVPISRSASFLGPGRRSEISRSSGGGTGGTTPEDSTGKQRQNSGFQPSQNSAVKGKTCINWI